MKSIKYITLLLLAAVFITSCERDLDSANVSKITYYPDMKMAGDAEMFVPTGSSFTDPGLKATEKGVELTVTTKISSDYFESVNAVDPNKPNRYFIDYKATNSDGYDGVAERVVYVFTTGDLVNSIEGLYTSTVIRNGVSDPKYTDMQYIMIRKTGDNAFELTDAIGGYYDLGRGYGAGYRASGVILTKNGANYTATSDFALGTFGGIANMSNIEVDAAAKTIKFKTVWDGGPYTFEVTLTQVQP